MQTKTFVVFLLLQFWALIIVTEGISCHNPSSYSKKVVCDHFGGLCGQCVSFVKKCTGDRRPTTAWKRGERVRNSLFIPEGTGIATFVNGKYQGHAAIYVGQDSRGIQVWDQWRDHPVSQRTIYWGGRERSNNGDSFYVID